MGTQYTVRLLLDELPGSLTELLGFVQILRGIASSSVVVYFMGGVVGQTNYRYRNRKSPWIVPVQCHTSITTQQM